MAPEHRSRAIKPDAASQRIRIYDKLIVVYIGARIREESDDDSSSDDSLDSSGAPLKHELRWMGGKEYRRWKKVVHEREAKDKKVKIVSTGGYTPPAGHLREGIVMLHDDDIPWEWRPNFWNPRCWDINARFSWVVISPECTEVIRDQCFPDVALKVKKVHHTECWSGNPSIIPYPRLCYWGAVEFWNQDGTNWGRLAMKGERLTYFLDPGEEPLTYGALTDGEWKQGSTQHISLVHFPGCMPGYYKSIAFDYMKSKGALNMTKRDPRRGHKVVRKMDKAHRKYVEQLEKLKDADRRALTGEQRRFVPSALKMNRAQERSQAEPRGMIKVQLRAEDVVENRCVDWSRSARSELFIFDMVFQGERWEARNARFLCPTRVTEEGREIRDYSGDTDLCTRLKVGWFSYDQSQMGNLKRKWPEGWDAWVRSKKHLRKTLWD